MTITGCIGLATTRCCIALAVTRSVALGRCAISVALRIALEHALLLWRKALVL